MIGASPNNVGVLIVLSVIFPKANFTNVEAAAFIKCSIAATRATITDTFYAWFHRRPMSKCINVSLKLSQTFLV
jgi:hypothetical protein